MKHGKLVHVISYSTISFVVIILIFVVAHQQKLLKSSSKDAAMDDPITVKTSPERFDSSTSINNVPDQINELEYQLVAAEEELDMTRSQLIEENQKHQDYIDKRRELIEKSQGKAEMKNVGINLYGAMLNNLGIYGEKRYAVNDLLADRQLAYMNIMEEMGGLTSADDNYNELINRQNDVDLELKQKLGELLGEELASKVVENFAKAREMENVSHFAEYLDSDNRMTDKQQEELVNSMYEVRLTCIEAINLNLKEGTIIDPTELSEEDMEKINKLDANINKGYMDSAKTILSETQYEQFQNYFEENEKLDKELEALENQPY